MRMVMLELNEMMRGGVLHARDEMGVPIFKKRPADGVDEQQNNVGIPGCALLTWHIEDAAVVIGDPWERGHVCVVVLEFEQRRLP